MIQRPCGILATVINPETSKFLLLPDEDIIMEVTRTSGISLVQYTADKASDWNAIVVRSRNGTFLINRAYMDYHADRFQDCSFLVLKKNKLEALIPGNRNGNVFYSHQGLTYGGVISTENITAVDTLEIFGLLNERLRQERYSTVVYKPVPSIYHCLPAEEDLYALFRNDAKLIARQISSSILQTHKIPFIESRKSGIRKAARCGVRVEESEEYAAFWKILSDVLFARHGIKPVHSLEEIALLRQRFPENIRLHVAIAENQTVAGVVMYVDSKVAHVQYIAASEKGKQCGALDLIFDQLINVVYSSIPVFEFGVSTEKGGLYLNESLIFQKEGFGGRGIVYDTYEYAL